MLRKSSPVLLGYTYSCRVTRSVIISAARRITHNIALYIPRTSDLNQLAMYVGKGPIEVVHYCSRRRSKVGLFADIYRAIVTKWQAITSYFGDLCKPKISIE